MSISLLMHNARARSHSANSFSQLAIRQADISRCRAGRAPLLHLRRCRFAKNSRSSSVTPVFFPGQRRSPARCGNNVHFSECTNFLHVHFQPRFKRLLMSCSRSASLLASSASVPAHRVQVSSLPLLLWFSRLLGLNCLCPPVHPFLQRYEVMSFGV